MPHYDAIIVLGSKPDPATWQFPSHVPASLDRAAELLARGQAPLIIVSGRWALSLDHDGLTQPFYECDQLAEHLIRRGVPEAAILKEAESKDTISNLYYIKRVFLKPRHLKRLLIITADFRAQRLRYLVQKVLGPNYDITIQTMPSQPGEPYSHEAETLARTKQFLNAMTDGDDDFLTDKFYDAPFYHPSVHKD